MAEPQIKIYNMSKRKRDEESLPNKSIIIDNQFDIPDDIIRHIVEYIDELTVINVLPLISKTFYAQFCDTLPCFTHKFHWKYNGQPMFPVIGKQIRDLTITFDIGVRAPKLNIYQYLPRLIELNISKSETYLYVFTDEFVVTTIPSSVRFLYSNANIFYTRATVYGPQLCTPKFNHTGLEEIRCDMSFHTVTARDSFLIKFSKAQHIVIYISQKQFVVVDMVKTWESIKKENEHIQSMEIISFKPNGLPETFEVCKKSL